MDKQLQQEGLTVVSLDESLFFYDTLVKRVWIEYKKPVVKITGSHKYSCLFGVISLDEKQIFRQYDKFDVYFDFLDYSPSFLGAIFFRQGFTSLQINEGRVFWTKQGYSNSIISSNCIPWVYDTRRGLEHSQTRVTCIKVLLILCRFSGKDIQIFQNKKIWSWYEELSVKRCLKIYVKWYNKWQWNKAVSTAYAGCLMFYSYKEDCYLRLIQA